jgi:superfamily I DNA/RNA helicase
MHTFENWRRNECIEDLETAYNKFEGADDLPVGWNRREVFAFCRDYQEWKAKEGLTDFTDMLEGAFRQRLAPEGVKAIVLDEAQDLSILQWRVVALWEELADREYIAGDDDQAIFQWGGAHPELFLNKECSEQKVLSQTYRFGRAIHGYSQRIIRRNHVRQDKEYYPRDEEGSVKEVDLSARLMAELESEGTVFVLVRNVYMLQDVMRMLRDGIIPWSNMRGGNSHTRKQARAIKAGMALEEGKACFRDLTPLLEYIPVRGRDYLTKGIKKWVGDRSKEDPDEIVPLAYLSEHWFQPALTSLFQRGDLAFTEAMTKEINADTKYFLKKLVQTRGYRGLDATPNITLCTGHGIKGMEADNVIIVKDMSGRTYDGYQRDHKRYEEENRLAYVEVTRARKGVYITNLGSTRAYDFPDTKEVRW